MRETFEIGEIVTGIYKTENTLARLQIAALAVTS